MDDKKYVFYAIIRNDDLLPTFFVLFCELFVTRSDRSAPDIGSKGSVIATRVLKGRNAFL